MAYIDGRDELIIQGNTLQWDHFDFAAPGRLGGVNYPTIITTTLNGVTQMNGVDWIPTWPDPPPNEIRFPAMSSVFTGLTPTIPDTTDVTLTVITARDSLTIAQLPTASNDFTTLLEFNDDPSGGAAWYEGLLTYASGTSTAAYGGGIANGGTLTVVNSTIADNTVASGGSGGGWASRGGTATLDNTIVALNTDGTGSGATPDDISGTVSSTSGYNLIGTGGSGGLTNGTNGNQVGVANPGLDPNGLQDNGGPTQTIALLPGSPAIDAGSNALAVDPTTGQPLVYDQRGPGFPRIVNGTVDIGAFEVQVSNVPAVTLEPANQTVPAGATASFTATAIGNPAPTVQWQSSTNGGDTFGDISGAAADTYSFTAVAGQNGDEYRAVFTNSFGSATSTAAALAVNTAPVVTTSPSDQTVTAGNTATFTATASGQPAPTVQWEVSSDGGQTYSDISGATADTYSFTAAAGQNGDQYVAVFTNSVGSVTSTAATLTVNTAPVVTTNPSSQTVAAGNTATFTATASGQPAPTVQWEVSSDGGQTYSDISGATNDTYSFTAAAGQNGDQYVAVFTNSVGSATTSAATLTVDSAPVVTGNPSDQTVTAGNTATFTAAASGQPAPTVQWEVSSDGGQTYSDISGATADAYSFTAVAGDNGDQYRAVFTNSVGSVPTSAALLTVTQPVTIMTAAVGWGTQVSPPLVTQSDGLRLLPAGRNTDMPWLGIDEVQITLSQAETARRRRRHGFQRHRCQLRAGDVSGSGTSYTITLAQPINSPTGSRSRSPDRPSRLTPASSTSCPVTSTTTEWSTARTLSVCTTNGWGSTVPCRRSSATSTATESSTLRTTTTFGKRSARFCRPRTSGP